MINGFILALFITFLSTPLVIKIAKKLHLVDDRTKRYHPAAVHHGVIPRAGGLAIYLGIACSMLFFIPVSKVIVGILLGMVIIVSVGLWDDYTDLSPYLRLMTNIAAALMVVGVGVGVPFITNPLGGVIHLDMVKIPFEFFGTSHSILILADLFAVIWIVWMMNAIGWSAGVDGQLPGVVVIAALVIAALSQRFAAHDISQTVVTTLAIITAGAFLGFLPWNFYPQKIMPGYGGKSLAGFLLAVLSILSGAKLGTVILVTSIPLIDALYTLIRRIASKKSPFKADRGHLHHLLLDAGWGKRRIAFFYWGVSLLLGILALTLGSSGKVLLAFILAVVVGVVLLTLRLLNLFRIGG